MQYSDWKMIGSLCFVLGSLFLLGGIIAYAYQEEAWSLLTVGHLRDYSAPLVIFGIVLLVVGFVIEAQGKEQRRLAEERPVGEVVYCSSCGTRNAHDAGYCKKCGKKLSTS
jgi:ribosomal protein L40E